MGNFMSIKNVFYIRYGEELIISLINMVLDTLRWNLIGKER